MTTSGNVQCLFITTIFNFWKQPGKFPGLFFFIYLDLKVYPGCLASPSG